MLYLIILWCEFFPSSLFLFPFHSSSSSILPHLLLLILLLLLLFLLPSFLSFSQGSNQRALIKNNLGNPVALAVDWQTRKLYWTDDGLMRIEVSNLDGSQRRILVSSGLSRPRDLAIHPTAGWVWEEEKGVNVPLNCNVQSEDISFNCMIQSDYFAVQKMSAYHVMDINER